jgi:peptidoglycan/xylan/chitin deacetylase (PgdA/CDA1 family)
MKEKKRAEKKSARSKRSSEQKQAKIISLTKKKTGNKAKAKTTLPSIPKRTNIVLSFLFVFIIGLVFYKLIAGGWTPSAFAQKRSLLGYKTDISSAPPPTSSPTPTLEPIKTNGETIINNGPRDKKQIALTFDADMTESMLADLKTGKVKSWYNEGIVNTLNTTHTKATIFMTGMWVETYPEATKELADNPLIELANHSYDHPGFDGKCYGLRPAKQEEKEMQIEKTNDLIEKVSGVRPRFFRFPGGCYGKSDLALAHKLNMVPIQWDVVGGDAFTHYSQHISDSILSQAQNGSIIVLHINGGPNAPGTNEVLSFVITVLKRRGYEFVTLSEMLGA